MNVTTDTPDGKPRCQWCSVSPTYINYHDNEWGFPVDDDFRLFEKICLEGFQSGLSWRTILTKRENFRQAFHNFDFNKIAHFTQQDVTHLLNNEGIVRHKGKIEATINNAKKAQEMIKITGSLASFLWQYEPSPQKTAQSQTVSTSSESIALSKDLKKLGWKFVGPTTMYALMQAMGLVNDHVEGCTIHKKVAQARRKFKRP